MSTRTAAQRAAPQLRGLVKPSGLASRTRSTPRSTAQVDAATANRAANKAIDSKQAAKWNTYLKAVSTLAFVASLAYLGAKVKGFKQAWDFNKEVEHNISASEETTQKFLPAVVTENELSTQSDEALAKHAQSHPKRSPYELDIAKQVAVLEDRKALLVRQRRTYEDKIRRIEERQAMAKGIPYKTDDAGTQ